MLIIRKITWIEMVEFVELRHPEVRGDFTTLELDEQRIRKIKRHLTLGGEMLKYLKSKGFATPEKTWILRGKPGLWALVCGKAA